jgi:hypothetical protein
VFSSFAGDDVPHSRQGGEEKKKAGQIRPFLGVDYSSAWVALAVAAREPTLRQWRPRVEEMRRHCFCGPEGLPCNSRLFWGYFVIFFICVICCLFYFKFLLFVITYGWMRKT